jgi:hypothetical protein
MSSYPAARKAFEDAKDLIKPPARDAVHWDMLNGLVHLTIALEEDVQELKKKVEHMELLLLQLASRR